MLEQKIEKLTEAVELLTQAILNTRAKGEARERIEAASAAPAPEAPAPEAPAPEATPSRDEIRALCLKLTRRDRNKYKPMVLDAIKTHGGELVDDVPDDRLAALKSHLESLV